MIENADSIANENIVRNAYNIIAKQYDSERGRFQNNLQLDLFLKYLPKNSKTILDAGCGSGRVMRIIQEYGFSVVGIDFSKEMLNLSRANTSDSELLEMDMSNLGFKDAVFDGIVVMYSIMHLPKIKHALIFEDFHRILRTSGCILVSLGIGELEIVEEYKPFGVLNYWSNADPNLSLATMKGGGFEILFDKVLEQGGERFYWIIARKI
jgi:ubiquinone/menaquinone biosynthesis C-methylase UbiE